METWEINCLWFSDKNKIESHKIRGRTKLNLSGGILVLFILFFFIDGVFGSDNSDY